MASGTKRSGANRVAALVAAYAIVLQAFFAGAAAARVDAAARDEAAYALCFGAGGPETPVQHPGKVHCVLCAVGGAQARAVDVTPAIFPIVYGEGGIVAWSNDFDRRPVASEFFQHRTRGPPTA